MAEFSVNPHRFDPYKNFKFRVKWEGRYVAGVSSVSSLRRTTESITYRSGSEPSISHKLPGRTSYAPITLKRGVTHDTEFEDWANRVWRLGAGLGSEVSLANFRKDIVIELLNEAGQVVKAYLVYRCWPSVYQAISTLDANSGEVAIEMLVLEHEGWERDESVTEPAEPKT
ncbi:MAG TPA: phage tail protein [Actinomycetota bacterium]|nr:phage tail protein [Actinomycetota bacterium]